MKTKELEEWMNYLRLFVLCLPLALWSAYFVNARGELIDAGKIESSVWVPKDAKVMTDTAEWDEYRSLAKTESVILLRDYKGKLLEEEQVVFVSARKVVYSTRQGAVLVSASQDLYPGHRVLLKNEVEYLGDGKFAWVVEDDGFGGIFYQIFMGFVTGVSTDFLVWWGVILLNWLFRKHPVQESTPSSVATK